MNGKKIGPLFERLGAALDDDNPPLLAVLVRANGEQLLFTYPLLERSLERGEVQDMLRALDIVGRAFDVLVDRLVGIERRDPTQGPPE